MAITRIGRRYSVWVGFGFSVSSLLLALSLSWLVLAKTQFLYGVWHDIGGIKEGIATYAPSNRYKLGFAQTTRAQRIELFSLINTAIHEQGRGLSDISYHTPTSHGPQLLLREPEVVHLQDVANLIDILYLAAIVNGVGWLIFVGVITKRSFEVLGFKTQLLNVFSMSGASLLVILFFGPTRVFNQLHIWVFPSDHEWFFYYQDSLMSTMMLAPTLFGWIALSWFLLSVIVYVGIVLIARFFYATLNKTYLTENTTRALK